MAVEKKRIVLLKERLFSLGAVSASSGMCVVRPDVNARIRIIPLNMGLIIS